MGANAVRVYLDASVLIPFLYGALETPDRFASVERLFWEIHQRRVEAVVAFYALQEVHRYIVRHAPVGENTDELFRDALRVLLDFPLIVVPYVERTEVNRWRHRVPIKDSTDVFHVAAAMGRDCGAIITYDRHFQDVTNVLPAYTPEEVLVALAETEHTE